jgi:putative ABC transport system substrate-binding protein
MAGPRDERTTGPASEARRARVIAAVLAAGLISAPAGFAQDVPPPVVGFLHSQSAGTFSHLSQAFIEGLREGGYEVGRNVEISYRWADGQFDRLPGLAAELAAENVAVIFTGGGGAGAEVARDATTTTPVVFISNPADMVEDGLVQSLGRPGGRLTGVGIFTNMLDQKRVQLMHELLPEVETMAVLNAIFATRVAYYNEAAAQYGVTLRYYEAGRSAAEIEAAFAAMAADGAEALLIGSDPFLFNVRRLVIDLAARHRIPTIYTQGEFVTEGGLISYSTSLPIAYREAGRYVARVLNGENPAEMPVMQDTTFDLSVNETTAEALGIKVPESIWAAATVIVN